MDYGPSGIEYRVAMLSRSYITVKGIIIQNLRSLNIPKLAKR